MKMSCQPLCKYRAQAWPRAKLPTRRIETQTLQVGPNMLKHGFRAGQSKQPLIALAELLSPAQAA